VLTAALRRRDISNHDCPAISCERILQDLEKYSLKCKRRRNNKSKENPPTRVSLLPLNGV